MTFAIMTGRASEIERTELEEAFARRPEPTSWAAADLRLWHAIATGDDKRARDLAMEMARSDPLNATRAVRAGSHRASRLGDLAALDVIVTEFQALGRQGRTMAATGAFIAALCTGADPSAEPEARTAVFRAAATAWRELACDRPGVALAGRDPAPGPGDRRGSRGGRRASSALERLEARALLAVLDRLEEPRA